MHIYSQAGTRVWAAMCEAMRGECNDGKPIPDEALPAEAAIRALDDAGLEKGAVLSLAYWFGSPRVADGEFDDYRHARAENEFVAREVSRFPDRLVGFFSVNPLKDYAVSEVRYWAEHGGLTGLKLHLANSAFDFSNPDHMEQLGAVIDVMNDHRLPVIIHLRHGKSGYGYETAALFIDQIASQAPDVTFQLAHMAGWGGYDDGTDGAVQAFLDAFADGVLDRERFWFDVAAVVDAEMPDAVLASVRHRVREIGFDRLLFASDWDEAEPAVYMSLLKERLRMSAEETDLLMNNEAPYIQQELADNSL
jgi:predicted TIM-barrel fold metal-dependent hydrolase